MRLADESLRSSLFDQDSLEQLSFAAYDTEALTLAGPYSAVFEKLFLGLSIPRRATVQGSWGLNSHAERHEAALAIHGMGADTGVRVDALWRGSLIAKAGTSAVRIQAVLSRWLTAEVLDADIIAALGKLPTDPTVLETQRRARLLQRLRGGVRQPAALTDAWLDQWLAQLGVSTVAELLARSPDTVVVGALQATFSAPPSTTATRPLPIAAALLIRNQPLAVAQLLADSRWVLDNLEPLGVQRPEDAPSAMRTPVLVIWMVPETVFDDPHWPGGDTPKGGTAADAAVRRRKRRLAAGAWLGREGIGLVVTAAPP